MRKSLALALLLALTSVGLSGCWDYRSLNEMSMVMGMAVDHDEETNMFKVSFEIADLANSSKDSAMNARLIETEGTTVFDCVRNAKKKLISKLYFAHMEVVVFGENMARDFGILPAIDWLMRDAEVRETTVVLIAKGTDAHQFLLTEGIDQTILAPELQGIIIDDNEVTSSTVYLKLYEVFSVLHCSGTALSLPAFSRTVNDGKPAVEADGTAVFDGDKLTGFLSPEETKYLLLAQGKAKGGVIPFSANGSDVDDTTFEISGAKAKTSFTYEDGVLTMRVDVDLEVFLAETMCDIDVMDETHIDDLEKRAGDMVAAKIETVIGKLQTQFGADILGFGGIIHQEDFKLWHELRPGWTLMFPDARVAVSAKVHILNTATIRAKQEDIE